MFKVGDRIQIKKEYRSSYSTHYSTQVFLIIAPTVDDLRVQKENYFLRYLGEDARFSYIRWNIEKVNNDYELVVNVHIDSGVEYV